MSRSRGRQRNNAFKRMMSNDWRNVQYNYGDLQQTTRVRMYQRLIEMLAISRFKWINLPKGMDERFIEMTLFERGLVIFFPDKIKHRWMATQATYNGKINNYYNPTKFRPVAVNYTYKEMGSRECVPIWDNQLRSPMIDIMVTYAERLALVDRALDVNLDNQSVPLIIQCDEKQKQTMENVMQQRGQGLPVIYITGNNAILDVFKQFPNTSQYLIDKLLHDKATIWNECVKFLGIENNNSEKKERVVVDEVKSGESATNVFRLSFLKSRQQAVDQINSLWPELELGISWGDDSSSGILDADERTVSDDDRLQ